METNNQPRRFSATMAKVQGALTQAPTTLMLSSSSAILGWAGLFLGVIAPLAFVQFGGPEWLISVSSATALWVLTWAFVGLVPVGARTFTPYIGVVIEKGDPKALLKIQGKRVLTLAPAMYLATFVVLKMADLHSQMYFNFIILGIATNVAALQEMWRKGLPEKPTSKFITRIVMAAVPLAIIGVVLNVCMVFIGSDYQHSPLWWIFVIVPELTLRVVIPICYEVLFLTGMGVILTRGMPWDWERSRKIAAGVVSNIGPLLAFIWLGSAIGNILADHYAATHSAAQSGIPTALMHIIAIAVVVRAPAYLVGGLGATWNAAGMNRRVKQLLGGWIKSFFGWLMKRFLIRWYGTQNTASVLLALVEKERKEYEEAELRHSERIKKAEQRQREIVKEDEATREALQQHHPLGAYLHLGFAGVDHRQDGEMSAADEELTRARDLAEKLRKLSTEYNNLTKEIADLKELLPQDRSQAEHRKRLEAAIAGVQRDLGTPPAA